MVCSGTYAADLINFTTTTRENHANFSRADEDDPWQGIERFQLSHELEVARTVVARMQNIKLAKAWNTWRAAAAEVDALTGRAV